MNKGVTKKGITTDCQTNKYINDRGQITSLFIYSLIDILDNLDISVNNSLIDKITYHVTTTLIFTA